MLLKINQISPNPNNPRTIRDESFATLKRSIAQFPQMLQKRGIAVIKEGKKWVAIGGNQRYRALSDLKKEIGQPGFEATYSIGEAEVALLEAFFSAGVPCIDCSDLSEAQRRRFVIADNQPFGEWDFDALASDWDAEELKDWGLDIPEWGDESGNFSDPGFNGKNQFAVLVTCSDEADQEKAFNTLTGMGYSCRVLTV